MKKFFLIITLFLFNCIIVSAQSMTVEQIFKNMKTRFNQVNDYKAEIEANVNLERIKMPKVKITVYFKQPDKFHYESKSFALLPKGGINFNPSDYPEDKFNHKLIGKETINNINCYKLEISPKESKKNSVQSNLYFYVDSDNFVIKRIVNEKSELFNLIIDFYHNWYENKYLLPSIIKLSYDAKNIAEEELNEKQPEKKLTKIQKGDITVNFIKYSINLGLNDDIFKQPANN
jgi:outer membrane lipoprotein-sorting protein